VAMVTCSSLGSHRLVCAARPAAQPSKLSQCDWGTMAFEAELVHERRLRWCILRSWLRHRVGDRCSRVPCCCCSPSRCSDTSACCRSTITTSRPCRITRKNMITMAAIRYTPPHARRFDPPRQLRHVFPMSRLSSARMLRYGRAVPPF
jgi:hypothetical protein